MRNFGYVFRGFIASVAMIMFFSGCLCSASVQKDIPVGYTYTNGEKCRLEVTDSGLTLLDATNLIPRPNGDYYVACLGSPFGRSSENSVVDAIFLTAIDPQAFDGFNQRFINAGQEPPEVRVPSNLLPGPDAEWTLPSNIVGY